VASLHSNIIKWNSHTMEFLSYYREYGMFILYEVRKI